MAMALAPCDPDPALIRIIAAAARGPLRPLIITASSSSTPPTANANAKKPNKLLLKEEFINLASDLFNQLNNLDPGLSEGEMAKKLGKAKEELNLGQGLLKRAQRESAPDALMKAAQDAFIRAVVIGISARNLNSILKSPELMTKISTLKALLIRQGVSLPPSKKLEMPTRVKQLKKAFERLCLPFNCNRNDIPPPAEGLLILIDRLTPHFPQYPALALWIQKFRIDVRTLEDVRTLDLSPKEITGIKDSLQHVFITEPFTSLEEARNFIAGFPKMTSLHMDCYHEKASLGMIKSMIWRKSYYRALASWINGHKRSLASLKLNKEEIEGIKPYLSYVDLSGMHFSTKDDAQNFIAGFPTMKHLTLFHSKTIGDTRVPLDSLPITPEQIKQLKYLDCSSMSIIIYEYNSSTRYACFNKSFLQ